jgi:hypothetical protein
MDASSRSGGALRDVTLIVVGVLIALAADAAVRSLGDRMREAQYLAALRENLEADVEELKGPLLEALDQREAAAKVVIASVSGDVYEPAHLVAALDRAGHVSLFAPRRATFDDLIGTGNLRLIRDPEVRAALIDYYDVEELNAANELVRQEIWYSYRPVIDEALDPLVMAEITSIEGDNTRNSLEEFAATIPVDLASRGLRPAGLRESATFRSGIASALEYTYVQRRQHNLRLARAEALLEILRSAG